MWIFILTKKLDFQALLSVQDVITTCKRHQNINFQTSIKSLFNLFCGVERSPVIGLAFIDKHAVAILATLFISPKLSPKLSQSSWHSMQKLS
jgi:hypothetical protein